MFSFSFLHSGYAKGGLLLVIPCGRSSALPQQERTMYAE